MESRVKSKKCDCVRIFTNTWIGIERCDECWKEIANSPAVKAIAREGRRKFGEKKKIKRIGLKYEEK